MTDRPARHPNGGCPFCNHEQLDPQMVAETEGFYLVSDLHPLREGHVLIIPRAHLTCYGALPIERQAEFLRLKAQAREFLIRSYGPPVFLEHGVAGQTVPHAHLHAVPGLPSLLPVLLPGREVVESGGLADVTDWYGRRGPYLYYEEGDRAVVLSPGQIFPGYLHRIAVQTLQVTGVAQRIDGAAASPRVHECWQRFRLEAGHDEVAVVTCFLWRGGRVCLFKRSERVGSARGKWHGVSGYLPDGTDPLRHAYAEVSQETGLGPTQVLLARAGEPMVVNDSFRGLRWRVYPFLFEVLEGEPRLNWEHVDFAWVLPHEIRRYDCVPWLPRLHERLMSEVE